MLILFAPALALAHGGGGGNGGVGGGMGHGNGGMGMSNGIGHGNGNGIGNGGGFSSSSNGQGMTNSSDRAVDEGPDSGSAAGLIAQNRRDAQERAAARQARAAASANNAHGAAVSAEAKLARSENDGDTVGQDVRAVARDRSTLPTHAQTRTHAHTKLATHTHPVNHGAAVSAEAKLAKSENDGDTVGADVSAVARDRSTLPTHAQTHTKLATRTHPANHGADVSAEAKLAKSENDGDTVGEDVSAVAKKK